jgi:uncharacterized membrane protein YeaQ/YmgE (transglycosylase-associated protein family)
MAPDFILGAMVILPWIAFAAIIGALAHARFKTGLIANIGVGLVGGYLGQLLLFGLGGWEVYGIMLRQFIGVCTLVAAFQYFKLRKKGV